MPIELPNLDDRTFADLVEEGKRLIPGFAPSWTDHNASDPGITLVELFASVTEMLIYRIDRISEANKRAFVELLAPNHKPTPGWTVDQEISAAVTNLRIEERAVTAPDFERLAMQVPGVARAHCLPRRNLESGQPHAAAIEALGHVSLLILCPPVPSLRLEAIMLGRAIAAVKKHLEGRCLVTTELHVVAPARLAVAVNLTLRIHPDQLKSVVEKRVFAALEAFFDRLAGGADHKGWPVGAPVYRADVYALMDQVEGVDYVELTSATNDLFAVNPTGGDRRIQAGSGYVGLELKADEVVAFASAQSTIDCQPTKTNHPS